MSIDIGYQQLHAYTVRIKCEKCGRIEESPRLVLDNLIHSYPGGATADKMKLEFIAALLQRGWRMEPHLCPDCLRRIVRETVDRITAAPEVKA